MEVRRKTDIVSQFLRKAQPFGELGCSLCDSVKVVSQGYSRANQGVRTIGPVQGFAVHNGFALDFRGTARMHLIEGVVPPCANLVKGKPLSQCFGSL